MIDGSGAPQLASLTDEEIINLIRVVPGLAASCEQQSLLNACQAILL